MRKLIIAATLIAPLLMSAPATAQDEAGTTMFAYATYFICSPDSQSRADEIIGTSFKPHYDAAVEQGDIVSWSWLQHYVGGQWRRVLVIIAEDMDSLLDASGALGEIIEDQTPEAGRAFSSICWSHDDYIWESVEGVGSGPASQERGAAGFTVYMQCDMSREDRADELVRTVFGPIYDRHIGDGQLTSWNWMKHNVGGKYRRILVLGAADHKSLMSTRTKIFEAFDERRVERAADEMTEICDSHQDYMWDIAYSTP